MDNGERFDDISDEGITNLMENRDSHNTKNVIKGAIRILSSYAEAKGNSLAAYEAASSDELNNILQKFYANVRTQKGDLYSKKSMMSVRYGLQKHFEKVKGFDIVNDTKFKLANKVFEAMLVKIKAEGKGAICHKSAISPDDLKKLYSSFDLDSPMGLQNKVFCDYMIYFCNRGRENVRFLLKTDIEFCGSGTTTGNEDAYRYLKLKDLTTKNHKGDLKDSGESQGGRMYPTQTALCPVKSMVKYLSKLNPECEFFWQRPHLCVQKNQDIWYMNAPIGKNVLGDKMKVLSKSANLSRIYTNHCLRATSVTIMDHSGYEARHIMSVSGHKSEASIRSYSRTDDSQKERMALSIAGVIDPALKIPKSETKMTVDQPPPHVTATVGPPKFGNHLLLQDTSDVPFSRSPYGQSPLFPSALRIPKSETKMNVDQPPPHVTATVGPPKFGNHLLLQDTSDVPFSRSPYGQSPLFPSVNWSVQPQRTVNPPANELQATTSYMSTHSEVRINNGATRATHTPLLELALEKENNISDTSGWSEFDDDMDLLTLTQSQEQMLLRDIESSTAAITQVKKTKVAGRQATGIHFHGVQNVHIHYH